MSYKKAVLFLICTNITSLYGEIIFDKAGVYVLGDDVDVDTFGNIQITASNVTLDLDGRTLFTGTATDVIVTGSLLNNITIMNGTIAKDTFTIGINIGQDSKNILIKDIQIKEVNATSNRGTTGINISSGCSHVTIDTVIIDQAATDSGIVINSGCRSITIENCYVNAVNSALRFTGAGGLNNDIQGIVVSNVGIGLHAPSNNASNYLFLMQYCFGAVVDGVVVTHTTPTGSGNSNLLSLMRIENSSGNVFRDLNFLDNHGPTTNTLSALDLSATSSCTFENIRITNQASSGTGALIGVRLDTGTAFNVFNGINIISQSNATGLNYGIQIGTTNTSACNGNVLNGCVIEALSSGGTAVSGIYMNGSSATIIDRFTMTRFNSTNGSGVVRGIYLLNGSSNYFNNGEMIEFENAGAVTGIEMNGTNYNKISDNVLLHFQAGTGVIGISTASNVSYTIIEGCIISGLDGASAAYGIACTPSASGSTHNSILKTVISRCCSPGSVRGILIGTNMTASLISGCVIQFNRSVSGLCIGIDFGTMNAGGGWSVVDNKIFNNSGVNSNNSYGLRQHQNVKNFYLRNIASANGTISSNQLSNVPIGSRVVRTFGTMSTDTGSGSSYAVTAT